MFFTYKSDVQEKFQLHKQSSMESLTKVEHVSSRAKDSQVQRDPLWSTVVSGYGSANQCGWRRNP